VGSWVGVELLFRFKSEVPENYGKFCKKKAFLVVAEVLALDYNQMKNM